MTFDSVEYPYSALDVSGVESDYTHSIPSRVSDVTGREWTRWGGLVRRLATALDREHVECCRLLGLPGASSEPAPDLHLLTSRQHSDCVVRILTSVGFKRLPDQAKSGVPGGRTYLGYDEDSGKLVRIRLVERVLLQSTFGSVFHLPLEGRLLASAVHKHGLRTITDEFEFLLLVLSLAFRGSGCDEVESSEQQRLKDLLTKIDRAAVSELIESELPMIGGALFGNCLEAVCSESTRRREDMARFLKTRLAAQRLSRRPAEPQPVGGETLLSAGLIIAVVGGDGAGKSTVIEGLQTWLAELNPYCTHMGKPPWSRTTKVVRGMLSLGRFVRRSPYVESGLVRNWEQGTVDKFPGYDKLIRDVLTARDRLCEFWKARRCADQGRIVLSDRFPLQQLQLMDGPQLPQLTAGHSGWLVRLLTKIERSYYPAIATPNVVIVLKVQPEVAVQRRQDEDAAFVRARSKSIWELNEQDLDAFFVDAAQDKVQVLSQVKRHIWSVLGVA